MGNVLSVTRESSIKPMVKKRFLDAHRRWASVLNAISEILNEPTVRLATYEQNCRDYCHKHSSGTTRLGRSDTEFQLQEIVVYVMRVIPKPGAQIVMNRGEVYSLNDGNRTAWNDNLNMLVIF
jgi:hypothetical protein